MYCSPTTAVGCRRFLVPRSSFKLSCVLHEAIAILHSISATQSILRVDYAKRKGNKTTKTKNAWYQRLIQSRTKQRIVENIVQSRVELTLPLLAPLPPSSSKFLSRQSAARCFSAEMRVRFNFLGPAFGFADRLGWPVSQRTVSARVPAGRKLWHLTEFNVFLLGGMGGGGRTSRNKRQASRELVPHKDVHAFRTKKHMFETRRIPGRCSRRSLD